MNNQTVFDFNVSKNHKLLFAAGTSMELAAGSTVKLPHISIEGCDNMWKGITVRQGATLEMSMMTVIKDAQYAVNIQKGGTLKATDCLFINNNYGVRTAPEGNGAYNLLVLGNHFATEGSGLKTAYAGQSPAPYAGRGYTGITLTDAGSFSIGNSINGSENMFSSLHYGIIAQNTNLSVKNTTFENIEKLPGVPGLAPFTSPGKAIYANGGSLSVTGGGILSGDPATFTNCHTGIECFQASLTATQNKMRAMNTGITSYFGIFKNVSVTSNDVEAQDYGIHVRYATSLANGCQVKDNIVAMSGNPDGVGIATGGSGDFIQFNGNFSNNLITVQQGKAGIDMGVCGNVTVTQNTITLNNNSIKHGIGLAGGDKNTINCNSISGAGEKGIYGLMAGRSAFICNSTTGTDLGIHFEGVFLGKGSIPVAGNTMSNNPGGGLLMGADAVIGEQVHRGNKWTGGVTVAQHLGGFTFAQFSLFTVDANENTAFLPNASFPFGWFVNISKPSPSYQCIPGPLCPFYATQPDTIRDTEIAKGELVGFAHPASQLWLAQRRLYERLTEEGNPYQGNANFNNFLTNAQTNGIKGYGDLQIGLRQLFVLGASDLYDLDSYEVQIAERLDSLTEKELALSAFEITGTDSTQLEGERAAILQELANLTSLRAAKLNSLSSARSSAAMALSSQNNALGGFEDHLLNEKTVNSIFLQTFALGSSSFSEPQVTSLENIASQCPLIGGVAVLQARDMLTLIQSAPIYYNDDIICNASPRPEERSENKLPTPTGKINVFPNPANSQITIQYDLHNTGNSRVQFFDVFGKLVQEVLITDSKGKILMATDKMASGVYIYTLDGATSGRIVISH